MADQMTTDGPKGSQFESCSGTNEIYSEFLPYSEQVAALFKILTGNMLMKWLPKLSRLNLTPLTRKKNKTEAGKQRGTS